MFKVRLGVVKQSFLGLLGQYGRRVTRANAGYSINNSLRVLILKKYADKFHSNSLKTALVFFPQIVRTYSKVQF